MKPILILGLGNPLRGDDGVGCRAIAALQEHALPAAVEAVDGGAPGLGLIHLLEGRTRVIVVDAAEMGRPPGAVVRFRLRGGEGDAAAYMPGTRGEGPLVTLSPCHPVTLSSHLSGVSEALALAQALGLPLPELVFFGVQPARVEWGEALSPEVAAAVPGLVRAILAEFASSDAVRAVSEVEVQEVSMAPRKTKASRSTGTTSRTKGRILIIDDDPDMVEALRMPLEANGYTVAHAASGRVGLKMVTELKPDLIVLDVMMETTTEGFQVSLALRSPDPASPYAAYREIPILMLTSIHSTTPLRFGPDQDYLPVDAFIDKPVDPDELLAKIARMLAHG